MEAIGIHAAGPQPEVAPNHGHPGSARVALIAGLEAAWGRKALVAAVERAAQLRRFWAADVRSILGAGSGVASVVAEGESLVLDLPAVPVRSLEDYRLERQV